MRIYLYGTNVLLLLALIAELLSITARLHTGELDLDMNQLLEASRQYVNAGVGRVPYFVNSTTGLDIVAWSHQFTTYLYAYTGIHSLSIWKLNYVIAGELVIAFFVVGWLAWEVSTLVWRRHHSYASLLWLALAYEPLYRMFWLGQRSYLRWSFIFACLSIIFLIEYWKKESYYGRIFLACGSGLATALSLLSYVSLGLPVLVGMSVVWLFEILRGGHNKLVLLIAYVLSVVSPLIISLILLLRQINVEDLINLRLLVSFYTSSNISSHMLDIGYLIISTFVPLHGISLLPIGIVALLINVFHLRSQSKITNRLTVTTAMLVIVWYVLAFVTEPSHLFPARMTWLLPLLLVQIALLWSFMKNRKEVRNIFVLFSVVIIIAQLIFQYFFRANVWLIAPIVSIALGVGGIWFFLSRRRTVYIPSMYLVGIIVVAIVYTPSLSAKIKEVEEKAWIVIEVLSETKAKGYDKFVSSVKNETVKYGQTESTWLTNIPVQSIFPEGAIIQAVSANRGLFSGAGKKSADYLALIGTKDIIMVALYPALVPGDVIYYRGFNYAIDKQVALSDGRTLWLGKPAGENVEDEIIIKNQVPVNPDTIIKYFEWREKNNIDIR